MKIGETMRKRSTENNTKEAILEAALKIFLTNGYEGTSVRMILEEAQVVTGSFYHFFQSKEDLFEQAVERFLSLYEKQFAAIALDDSRSFWEQLNWLIDWLEHNLHLYFTNLQTNQLHWTVQYSFHKRTLQALLPYVEILVKKALEKEGAKNPLKFDITTLSTVLLQGIEGIIHVPSLNKEKYEEEIRIRENVISYVTYLLGFETNTVQE